MALELFAQQDAENVGFIIGVALAVIFCGSIPILVGLNKGQPILGVVGGICAGGSAVLLGCLLGLPVAGAFVVMIYMIAGSGDSQSRRRRGDYHDGYEDEYDDHRRGRERDRGRSWDDDDDDRPRRRRRDDD